VAPVGATFYDEMLPVASVHTADLRCPGASQASGAGALAASAGVSESKSHDINLHQRPASDSKSVADDVIMASAARAAAPQATHDLPPFYLALKRRSVVFKDGRAPEGVETPSDPVVDVMIVSRSEADCNRPWSEFLPVGYEVVECTHDKLEPASFSARSEDVSPGAGKFVAFLRMSAWRAGMAATATASAYSSALREPPLPPVVIDIDVVLLDPKGQDDALPGFRLIERTSQSILPASALLQRPPGFASLREEPATLGGANARLAVRTAVTEYAMPLAECPLTGVYTVPEYDDPTTLRPFLEFSAVHLCEGSVVCGKVSARVAQADAASSAAQLSKYTAPSLDGSVSRALLQELGAATTDHALLLSENVLVGVAVPASTAKLMSSVASGAAMTPAMYGCLGARGGTEDVVASQSAQDLAQEPLFLVGICNDANMSTIRAKYSLPVNARARSVDELRPLSLQAIFSGDGFSAEGSLEVSGCSYKCSDAVYFSYSVDMLELVR
jgi:hypothetical protein